MTRLLACLALLLLPAAAAAELVDDTGSRIQLDADQPRVVTLAPHLAELVFAIGAGPQLAGTVEWSNHPEAAQAVPRIGDAFRIDYERVMELQPGLVLAWGGGTPTAVIERLRELGLVVAVLEPTTLDSIAGHLQWLGRALGHVDAGRQQAAAFREELQALRDAYAGREPLRVFYQVSSRPLYTVNGRHTISEMLRVCGASNIFSELDKLAPAVTLEAVLGRNPQAIVAGSYALESGGLERWREWQEIAAVRAGNLMAVDAEVLARATPRMLQAGADLCRQLDAARERIRSD